MSCPLRLALVVALLLFAVVAPSRDPGSIDPAASALALLPVGLWLLAALAWARVGGLGRRPGPSWYSLTVGGLVLALGMASVVWVVLLDDMTGLRFDPVRPLLVTGAALTAAGLLGTVLQRRSG